jgi:hypothetical protein
MLINLDEEPSKNDNGLINFHKLRKIGGVFRLIDTAKSVPYSFKPNRELLDLFAGAPQFSHEDPCWTQSKASEAKLQT